MRISRILLVLAVAVPVLGIPAAAPAAGAGFSVVSFSGRITSAARAALDATGATVVDYEPHDSYIVWATPEQARAAEALGTVRPLSPARKVNPSAWDAGLVEVTAHPSTLGSLPAGLRTLDLYPPRPGGIVAVATVRADARAVAALAADPRVLYVSRASTGGFAEDEATDQILAGNLGTTNRPVPGYLSWLASTGLDGSGIKVAIVDTGINPQHPDYQGRIAEWVNYGALPTSDASGHGTHVAGIVGGSPQATASLKDTAGFVYGLGVAPEVQMLSLNAIGIGVPFPHRDGISRYARDAWDRGARMWNASWHTGEGSRVGYVAKAREMDVASRDVHPFTPGREEFLLVFSAGNAGASGPTVPKEAKNILAVGSTVSGRDLLSRGASGSPDVVSSTSSRGPTADGRIFPTISAPGDSVVSARAPEGSLIAAACIAPPLGAGLYAQCSGTSMAAPHITGAAALLHEHWLREHGTLPSPALVKALMVNSATDIGARNIPNTGEGWGRLNLQALFTTTPRLTDDQTLLLDEPGQELTRTVTVADPAKPLRITVAWADAPGATGADPALVNDLDLVVERLDEAGAVVDTWLGNVFSGGKSVGGGEADRLNNLENVYLDAPAGNYRITVRAHNIPGDGVPFAGDTTDQDFALVIRNAVAA